MMREHADLEVRTGHLEQGMGVMLSLIRALEERIEQLERNSTLPDVSEEDSAKFLETYNPEGLQFLKEQK